MASAPAAEPVIEVLVHVNYGGLSFTPATVTRYKMLKGIAIDDLSFNIYCVDRHDPVLVELVKCERAREYRDIQIHRLPVRFASHYRIDDFDGMESLQLLYTDYRLRRARDFLDDPSLTDTERVERVRAVFDEPEPRLDPPVYVRNLPHPIHPSP